jgi:hypothetical protein
VPFAAISVEGETLSRYGIIAQPCAEHSPTPYETASYRGMSLLSQSRRVSISASAPSSPPNNAES